jgi:hypothetical protein
MRSPVFGRRYQQVAENLEDELGPEDRALFGVYLSILDDSALGERWLL